MPLADLTREAVLAAIHEFNQLGRSAFLAKYDFKPATQYHLLHEDEFYDSKAICGAAHGHLTGRPPLTHDTLSGEEKTVQRALSDLGFHVERGWPSPPSAWLLSALSPDDREYAGNDGYEDDPQSAYRFDSSVPNHKRVAVGHTIILRDKTRVFGLAKVQEITSAFGTKNRRRCPVADCGSTKLVERKRDRDYRCSDCNHTTQSPLKKVEAVTTFVAHYGPTFVPIDDLPLATVKDACPLFNQNNAIQAVHLGPRLLETLRSRAASVFDVTATSQDAQPRLPSHGPLGRPYSNVGSLASVAPYAPFEIDPDKVDRGTQAHATTTDLLADHLRSLGITPLQPGENGPEFDLAWEHDDRFYVAEVKSLTDENEEKQLRLGLGQVLRYRHRLSDQHARVVGVLVAERPPSDLSWREACSHAGIMLVWPDDFASQLPLSRQGCRLKSTNR